MKVLNLSLSIAIMLSSGCAFVSLMDADLDTEYSSILVEDVRLTKDHLDDQYRGYSKSQIIEALGQPHNISNTGGYQYSYNGNCSSTRCDCSVGVCRTRIAQERWSYRFTKTTRGKRSSYSVRVLFDEGIVVRVF